MSAKLARPVVGGNHWRSRSPRARTPRQLLQDSDCREFDDPEGVSKMATQDTRVGRVGHEPEVTIGTDQREAIGSDSIPFSDRVVGVDHPVLWLTTLRWL